MSSSIIFILFTVYIILFTKCESIPKAVLRELQTPNLCFSDNTIDHFIKLVRQTTKFDMIDVVSFYYPELYQECPVYADDVQILYGGEINKVGHFIGIFYTKQTVYVYDSLHLNSLHARQIQIINLRYPKKKHIEFIKPKIIQVDDTSCGPLAIGYITTLIMGEDPATYPFKMDTNGIDYSSYLRKHIEKMFKDQKLSHFPQNAVQNGEF